MCVKWFKYHNLFPTAQLWKLTCDGRLENKKTERDWKFQKNIWTLKDGLIEDQKTKKLLGRESNTSDQIKLQAKGFKNNELSKWIKSSLDENEYFTLTDPKTTKLLTVISSKKLKLEGNFLTSHLKIIIDLRYVIKAHFFASIS